MTTYREGFLGGSSHFFQGAPHDAFAQNYGIGLFSTSWDERSVAPLVISDLSIKVAIVLRAEPVFTKEIETTHFDRLSKSLAERGARIVEIASDIREIDRTWEEILKAVAQSPEVLGEPSFIDLSVAPIFYSIGLINALVLSGFCAFVDVFYSEAEYVRNHNVQPGDAFPFSFGQWESIPIPFLMGSPQPSKKRHFFVSVGFEGAKTMRVLAKSDPDLITVLLPIPGFRKEYDDEVQRRNQAVIDSYSIPQDQIVKVSAGDAIATWKVLSRSLTRSTSDQDLYYLCCGTKPHSLGLALSGLASGRPCVLYNRPESLNETEIRETGRYWKYKLWDSTSGFGRRSSRND